MSTPDGFVVRVRVSVTMPRGRKAMASAGWPQDDSLLDAGPSMESAQLLATAPIDDLARFIAEKVLPSLTIDSESVSKW